MVQIVKCKCGSIFAACVEPNCYEDTDWTKNLSEYSKKGYVIEMVESNGFKFSNCSCETKMDTPNTQLSLF